MVQLQGMKNVLLALALAVVPVIGGCARATDQPRTSVALGQPSSTVALESVMDVPGEWTVETILSASWVVDRSGLINLDHPKAKAAHLTDGDEPIGIYFHALRHPAHGLYIVDSGVERAFRDAPREAIIHGVSSKLAHLEKMTIRTPLGDWTARQPEPVRGVFLTHLHLDHVLGLRDLPHDVPIWVGAGDADAHSFENVFMSSIYDAALAGKGPLREWTLASGVADVFGDGSLWAIAVPGHTKGSTAFVTRTTNGPVLLTGDACHTRWGWENSVEPGSFSTDPRESVGSLALLEALAARHPSLDVRLGHQEISSGSHALDMVRRPPTPTFGREAGASRD